MDGIFRGKKGGGIPDVGIKSNVIEIIRLIRYVNVTGKKREKQQATFHKFLIVTCVFTTISQSSTSSTHIATFCAVKEKQINLIASPHINVWTADAPVDAHKKM